MKAISLRVNGEAVVREVHDNRLLLHFLRDDLELSGTKEGCSVGVCGACTVLLDGAPVSACLTLAVRAAGCEVTTIEGLAQGGRLHPLQQAFIDFGGYQCGICTPGQIMAAKALLDANPHPSKAEIREWMMGNLCRCTGYYKIIESIEAAAEGKSGAVTPFTYLEPSDVEEALAAMARYGEDAKVIAGGTGLINLMKQELVQPAYVIGLRRLTALASMRHDGELRIGALCTQQAIEAAPLVRRHIPLLAETCRLVATVRIRSMATLGGAVAHADPNLDTPPALIVLDARIRLRSRRDEREVPIDQFFTGYYETVIQPDELILEVVMPPQPEGSGAAFIKFLPATHDDYATVSVAARVTLGDGKIIDARVALGAAAPTPLRAIAVEAALRGRPPTTAVLAAAADLVADAVDPVADLRGSVEYKRDMAVVHVRRALAHAVLRAETGA